MSRTDDIVQERIERLLPSQKFWMTSPETERVDMGGWRAGKTRIGCLTALLCSYLIPDNFWFIGRASAKDLHSTTMQTFFDEVCPSEMIVGKPKAVGQSGKIVTLRTKYPGFTSQIYFDYIMDKQTNRSHLAGGNWGGYLVDQIEEINRGAWHKLMGRLSRTYYHPEKKAKVAVRTHALGVGNQMGHDWIFEDFFQGGDYKFDLQREPKTFFKAIRRGHRLGVIVRSEENRMSNGGFVPDEYYDNLRASMPPEWIARYLDGSFDDFSGKIYSDYNLDSVHNIEPFPIPSHWPWGCSIDPGGSSPWGVGVWRVDEMGNKICVNDASELYTLNLNPNKAIKWIKNNTPVEDTRFLIDYQNKAVMVQFGDEGITCEPANKEVFAGLMRTKSEFFVNPERQLPEWYLRTQPADRVARFAEKGSPTIFNFNTNKHWMKEHDNYIWDLMHPNEPKNNQADHHCFTAGTEVSSGNGKKNIEDVRVDDFVWTRAGLRKVIYVGCRDDEVGYVEFSNGRYLEGTADHPIWTQQGWKRLDAIRYSDTIVICKAQQLYSTGLHLGATQIPRDALTESTTDQTRDIFETALDIYTKKSGNSFTDQFPQNTKSITPTKIRSIILRKISSVLQRVSIESIILEYRRRRYSIIWRRFAHLLRNGIQPVRVALCTAGLENSVCRFNGMQSELANVFSAEQNTSLGPRNNDFAPIIANQPFDVEEELTTNNAVVRFVELDSNQINTAAQKPVLGSAAPVSQWKLVGKRRVYNLTVAGEHEYFANGILVSNCDETRYWVVSSPQPAAPVIGDGISEWRRSDPTSADVSDRVSRELRRLRQTEYLENERAADPCDGGTVSETAEFISSYGE